MTLLFSDPAHTVIANMMKVNPELTKALSNRTAMPTPKRQALHDTTLAMVRSRGGLCKVETEAFFAAGYGQRQLLGNCFIYGPSYQGYGPVLLGGV